MFPKRWEARLGEKIHWDGHSPLAGEPVENVIFINNRQYAFTASRTWEIDLPAPVVFPPNDTPQ